MKLVRSDDGEGAVATNNAVFSAIPSPPHTDR